MNLLETSLWFLQRTGKCAVHRTLRVLKLYFEKLPENSAVTHWWGKERRRVTFNMPLFSTIRNIKVAHTHLLHNRHQELWHPAGFLWRSGNQAQFFRSQSTAFSHHTVLPLINFNLRYEDKKITGGKLLLKIPAMVWKAAGSHTPSAKTPLDDIHTKATAVSIPTPSSHNNNSELPHSTIVRITVRIFEKCFGH